MRRFLILTLCFAAFLFSSCRDYDDFEFAGTVVGFQYCTSLTSFQDLGYLIELTSPEGIDGEYTADDGTKYHHVVVVYKADQLLRDKAPISGRMYFDDNFSKTNCYIHFDDTLREGIFTRID